MKVQGRKPSGLREELLVLPREDGDYAFKFRAVSEDFPEKRPEPARKLVKGAIVQDANDPEYRTRLDEWAVRKAHWHFLMSIAATEGLEWETVNIEQPATWANWEEELKNSGWSDAERQAIWQTYIKANFLSEDMLDEARKRFLAGPQVSLNGSLSPTTEPATT